MARFLSLAFVSVATLLVANCAVSETVNPDDLEPVQVADFAIRSATLSSNVLQVAFDGAASAYQCKVDVYITSQTSTSPGTWEPCISPFQYDAKLDGKYSVTVKSSTSELKRDIVRDNDAPQFLSEDVTDDEPRSTFEFTITDSQFLSGDSEAGFEVRANAIDDNGFVADFDVVPLTSDGQYTKKGSITFSNSSMCSDGAMWFWLELSAKDRFGNVTDIVSEYTWYCP